MKRLKFSIKLKVTLWFTFFNLLIVGLIFVLLINGSKSNLQGEYQRRLIKNVEEAADEIEYDDGGLDIDIDAEDYPDNIRLVVYNEAGQVLYGHMPNTIKEELPFKEGDMRQVTQGEKKWFIYDIQKTIMIEDDAARERYWVRGILATDSSTIAISSIISTAFILFPVLVLLAAIGGYLVTKRAFRPIENLNREIASIDNGSDLARRVDYKGAKDEIYTLTQSFNEMFGRLEDAFVREKQFTSDASHELRTPIAVIKAECEYGLMQKEHPEEMQSALKSIQRQSQNMSTLVNQLLTLARADRGNMELSKEKFDLCELTEMVIESLEEQAEEKKVKLYTDMPERIEFYGDQTLIMRMLINLISNGITYSIDQEGYVKVSLEEKDTQIICVISDNGIGIAKEHQDKIWNRFYQVDTSRSKMTAGSSGLGLAMVKWIVEVHGGEITLESEYKKGSAFKVVLPKAR